MLDWGSQYPGVKITDEAKDLVASYLSMFKNAVSEKTAAFGGRRTICWDEVIEVTNASLFFQLNPGLLEEVNPDLVSIP